MVNVEVVTKVFTDKRQRDLWIKGMKLKGYIQRTFSFSKEDQLQYWTIGVYKK